MTMLTRRLFTSGLLVTTAMPALAQHAGHGPMYERLDKPGRVDAPAEVTKEQWVTDSPAPKAANQGKWISRAPLPLPRSEMAWATVLDNKMHIVGGYGEQRVDRPYHHVYDPPPTNGSTRRNCRAGRTMSASRCWMENCMPSAASSSRTASRTISVTRSKEMAGGRSCRCRKAAAPWHSWR